MEDVADTLAGRIAALPPRQPRLVIALAGPPGSGKSTLAEALVARLNRDAPPETPPPAALVPMDGFHLDDRLLTARGLLPRKGAPETFDAAGLVHAVRRLRSEPEVVIPVFDRAREIAVAGAAVVGPDTRVAVVEGNYLLLRAEPWRDLAPLWNLTVFLDVPEGVLAERLMRRWLGFGYTEAEARAKVEGNDLRNARLVLADSLPADIIL